MSDERALEFDDEGIYYEDSLDEQQFEDEYTGSSILPWWVKKAPPILVSGIFHAVILIISAYMITNYFIEKKRHNLRLSNQPHKKPLYDPELKKWTYKSPKILAKIMEKKPVIMLEEEVEMTRDIPRGTSFDNLSNQ